MIREKINIKLEKRSYSEKIKFLFIYMIFCSLAKHRPVVKHHLKAKYNRLAKHRHLAKYRSLH